MKVNEIIDKIIKKTGMEKLPEDKTCDRLIVGDPDQEVTGIVSTFMATVEVIQETIRLGANFIITHEPTWYTGNDKLDWLEKDDVFIEKKKLMKKHNIAVWRFHDYMHIGKEDLIYTGVIKELGWEEYQLREQKHCFIIPEIKLKSLCTFFKNKLNMNTVRIVGNEEMVVKRVGILVGGGSLGLGIEEMPMKFMRDMDLDVIVCGDIIEWTLTPYVRDAQTLGYNKSMIILGHERSEEFGMKHLDKWFEPIINDTPIYFVDAKEPFKYL